VPWWGKTDWVSECETRVQDDFENKSITVLCRCVARSIRGRSSDGRTQKRWSLAGPRRVAPPFKASLFYIRTFAYVSRASKKCDRVIDFNSSRTTPAASGRISLILLKFSRYHRLRGCWRPSPLQLQTGTRRADLTPCGGAGDVRNRSSNHSNAGYRWSCSFWALADAVGRRPGRCVIFPEGPTPPPG